MDKFNVVYVDDDHQDGLSKYLHTYCTEGYTNESDTIQGNYEAVEFNCGRETYKDLFQNKKITTANIIVIDSQLFEHSNAGSKFTGEEFRIILRKTFPYIEVIVITQTPVQKQYGIISKYKTTEDETEDDYYLRTLKDTLDKAMSSVLVFNNILSELKTDGTIDAVLVQKISSSLEGGNEYQELTKKNIDDLVENFQEIKALLTGKKNV